MTKRIDDLAKDFIKRGLSRRDFARKAGALGLGAAATNFALGGAMTSALAADFNWQANKGKTIRLLLDKHPYADAMISDLAHFTKLTGIQVEYDIFPEDVYFDKVTAALSSHSTRYDVIMSGAYQTWQYGPAGWLVDMNEYLSDPIKTAPMYDFNGIIASLRQSDAWSGVPGDALGGKGSKQWAIPLGFELYNISYNKKIFDKLKIEPPKNLPDMIEVGSKITKDAGGAYGVSVRGSRSWATIHPGYLSAYTNYGAKDFDVSSTGLKSTVNSPQSKEMNKLWVKMIQDCGPKNWATYTWYEVAQDLGAGRCGMIYDANIIGFFENAPGNAMSGQIGYASFTANPNVTSPSSNVWIWSLTMSNFSQEKDAAWYFIQWASGKNFGIYGGVSKQLVDPVRKTTWSDPAFKARLNTNFPGFYEAFEQTLPGAKIYFTPQPLFFNATTQWAAMLQQMVANEVSVDDGLDKLASQIDSQLQDAGI